MQEHPWVFCEGLLFIFGVRAAFGLDACCFFPQCASCYPLDSVLCVLPGRWRQWAGLVASA